MGAAAQVGTRWAACRSQPVIHAPTWPSGLTAPQQQKQKCSRQRSGLTADRLASPRTTMSTAPPVWAQLLSKAQLVNSPEAWLSSSTAPPPLLRPLPLTRRSCSGEGGGQHRLVSAQHHHAPLPAGSLPLARRNLAPLLSPPPPPSCPLTLLRVSFIQGPVPYSSRPFCLASRMQRPPSEVHMPCIRRRGIRWWAKHG